MSVFKPHTLTTHVLGRTKLFIKGFVQQTGASSAVEFALLAPVLVLMTVSTFDLGSSISNRMALDGILRNGAQTAMEYGSVDEIVTTMERAAQPHFAPGLTQFTANAYCTCGTVENAAVSCTASCDGGSTSQFIQLTAAFSETGILTPEYSLSPSMSVQVR